MLIPNMLKMAPDELMVPWLEHLAVLNGMTTEQFYEYYFRKRYRKKGNAERLYPFHISRLCACVSGNTFFPSEEEALLRHTPYLIEASYAIRGMAAFHSECILYRIKNSRLRGNRYRICPECRRRDMESYGRTVIHVPHQAKDVSVCWEHGCRLIYEDSKPVPCGDEKFALRVAGYVKALYSLEKTLYADGLKNVIETYASEKGLDWKGICEAAHGASVITEKESREGVFSGGSRVNTSFLVRLLAYAGPDVDTFAQDVTEDTHIPVSTEEFELLWHSHGIGRYRCGDCGHEFVRHERAVEVGYTCPVCGNGLDEEGKMRRLLERYGDGQYEVVPGNPNRIRHKPCGRERPLFGKTFFTGARMSCVCAMAGENDWHDSIRRRGYICLGMGEGAGKNHSKKYRLKHEACGLEYDTYVPDRCLRSGTLPYYSYCPVCGVPEDVKDWKLQRDSKKQDSRYRMTYTGIGVRVVEYVNYDHIRIRFDNGMERWMSWDNFADINENKRISRKWKEIHFGEERLTQSGEHIKIIEYHDCKNVVIQFDDGATKRITYKMFKEGCVAHP